MDTTTKPEVGMGATEILGSDKYAYTIVKVCTPRKILVQQDTATRTDDRGDSTNQEYSYERNPEAPLVSVTLRKNGQWRKSKEDILFRLGVRREYYDYNF